MKGGVNSAPYSAAKAGIIGFTRALVVGSHAERHARQCHRARARRHRPDGDHDPADRQAFIEALPVGRFGRPEEIAATALLLAGPDGGFYVGATLSPNGGDVMY